MIESSNSGTCRALLGQRKYRKKVAIQNGYHRCAGGPKKRRRTILSVLQEAVIVSLRFQAWLPLDNVYIALKTVIPHLLCSNLYRC